MHRLDWRRSLEQLRHPGPSGQAGGDLLIDRGSVEAFADQRQPTVAGHSSNGSNLPRSQGAATPGTSSKLADLKRKLRHLHDDLAEVKTLFADKGPEEREAILQRFRTSSAEVPPAPRMTLARQVASPLRCRASKEQSLTSVMGGQTAVQRSTSPSFRLLHALQPKQDMGLPTVLDMQPHSAASLGAKPRTISPRPFQAQPVPAFSPPMLDCASIPPVVGMMPAARGGLAAGRGAPMLRHLGAV